MTDKGIGTLRILLACLVILVVAAMSVFFLIRSNEQSKITEALSVLKEKDRDLEIMEKSFQQLSQADNDFRLYTLTYDPDLLKQYYSDLEALTATLDSLRTSCESFSSEIFFLDGASESILRKEDLTAHFIRLKRLTDSLLFVAVTIDSLRDASPVSSSFAIQRFYPDTRSISIDTLTSLSVTEKKKKGFFAKVKSFFIGETQKTTTEQQVKVTSGSEVAEHESDSVLTVEDISLVIAGQTNSYYQRQLRLQKAFRERMRQQELKLVLTDKALMGDFSRILNLLKNHVKSRNNKIHGDALNVIAVSTRIINITVIVSIGMGLILLVLMILTSSQVVRYQKRIVQARQKAENEALEKSRFLAYMSHEIRTPLTSIVGFTEQLRHTTLDTKQERFVNSMQTSCEMLLITVNDILDISKLDAGRMKFFKSSLNPVSVIEQVLNSFRPASERKGLRLILNKYKNEHILLSGDEMRLKQVLINLVNNAIKYTEHGEITVTLSLSPRGSKHFLQIAIADTGIGIPKDKLEEVFSEYSQIHEQSAKKWIIGTGLGLPICKKIVEMQGGTIRVTSELGKGSTFTFSIPYEISKEPAEEFKLPDEGMDPSIFIGKRILVVDDTEINLVLLDAIFEKWKVKVDMARNGKEAMALIGLHPYDLIVSDVNMPEVDGVEMTKRIRHNPSPQIAKTPVIILTANILQDEVEKFQNAGVSGYLMKPFLMIDLYQVVRKYMA
ncbi:MAG: ATP-binding protein [bacterium]